MLNMIENESIKKDIPEVHLFIIWNKARHKENEIINEIKKELQILEIYEVEWTPKLFKQNLEQFYQEKIRRKIRQTGTGKFLFITVKDNHPEYNYEQTLKGYEPVNSKILRMKKAFRKLTGNFNVHSTNDIKETDKNLVCVLGKSYKEYYEYAKDKEFDGNYIKLKKDPNGALGWNSLDEIFKVLNSSCNYVVLRGIDEKGGDIDLLVDSFEHAKYLLNAKKVHRQKYRPQVMVNVDGKPVYIDLMNVGDNYYCENWEENILINRVFDKRGFYTPNDEDLFYSLIYHALFHKKKLSDKYNSILENLANKVTDCSPQQYKQPYDLYCQLLYKYLETNDYFVTTKPVDKKVKMNHKNIRKMHWIHLLTDKYKFNNLQTFAVNKKPCSDYEFFFTADYNNEKVFIKCGNGNFYAKKEFEVYNYLNNQNSQYFPKAITYKHLANNKMFLCIEYIEGETLSKKIQQKDFKELNILFNSLNNIAEILFKNKFIHRDINPDNIIITKDGSAKVIDTQHLIGNGFKEAKDNITYPKKLRGTNKKLRPFAFVWDDMYSIYSILKTFDGSKIDNYEEKMQNLKSKIGKQRYYFFDNKFTLKSYLNYNLLLIYKPLNSILKPFRKIINKI